MLLLQKISSASCSASFRPARCLAAVQGCCMPSWIAACHCRRFSLGMALAQPSSHQIGSTYIQDNFVALEQACRAPAATAKLGKRGSK